MRWLLPIVLLVAAAPAVAAAAALAPRWCILSVEESGPAGPADGALAILDPAGQRLARLPMGEKPHEVAVSSDGATAFVSRFGITDYDSKLGTPGTQISRVDLASARETARFELPGGLRAPHGLKLRPPAEAELYVNAEVGGDTMVVFDAASGAVKRRFELPRGTHNFVFAPDGAALFAFAGAEGVYRIDAATGAVGAQRKFAGPVRGLAIDAPGRVMAATVGAVEILDPATLASVETVAMPQVGQLLYLDPLPGGGIAAPAFRDGGVLLFDRASGRRTLVPTGKTPIFARAGPDGRVYVANVEDDHLSVVDPKTLAAAPLGKLSQPNGLAFGACPR